MSELFHETITRNNWFQGVVIAYKEINFSISFNQRHASFDSFNALVLFTHDCDLVNPSIEKEPYAEFFLANYTFSPDAAYQFGRHPRILHIETGSGKFLEIGIHNRITVDRTFLAGLSVDSNSDKVHGQNLAILLDWLTKKYVRPAFPDAFNAILKEIRGLNKKLRRFDRDFPSVIRLFFKVEPESIELIDSSPYCIDVILLLEGKSRLDDDEEKEQAIENFRNIFSHDRLKILSCECAYENELSLFELRSYKVWDRDYISIERESEA